MRDTNTDPATKGKLRLTSCACAFLGVLTTLGIGFGVSTCISALSPSPSMAASPTQQVDLSDPNIRVTYAADGTMYVDIYVHNDNTSDVNVNLNDPNKKPLDEGGDYDNTTTENQGSTESGNDQKDDDQNVNPDNQNNNDSDVKPDDGDNDGNNANNNTDDTEITDSDNDGDLSVDKPGNDQSHGTDEIGKDDNRPSGDDEVYNIVWGDTLSKISSITGYSVDFLAEYNHINNPNLIYAGSTIRYPKK